MFDFIKIAYNYDGRKVKNTEINGICIDTCAVSDSDEPYETAISHPDYNGGDWIIVEMHNSRELAAVAHDKWVDRIKNNTLCDLDMIDVSTASIKKLYNTLGGV